MIKYLFELCLQGLRSLGGKCLGYSILAPTSSHKEKNNEKHTLLLFWLCDINLLLKIYRFELSLPGFLGCRASCPGRGARYPALSPPGEKLPRCEGGGGGGGRQDKLLHRNKIAKNKLNKPNNFVTQRMTKIESIPDVHWVQEKPSHSTGKRGLPSFPLERWTLGLGFSCPHWKSMMDSKVKLQVTRLMVTLLVQCLIILVAN